MMTKLLALGLLSFGCHWNINDCLAFQPPSAVVVCRRDVVRSTTTTLNLGKAHQEEYGVRSYHDGVTSRRSILSMGAATLLPILTSKPNPSNAVVGGATQSARVSSWPGIESIEPLWEFKLSLDAIVVGVQDPKNWPYIQKRLEKFFGGFIVNEKNFYMGVGLQYMNEIQYDSSELPNYVVMDKESRFEALDNTMKNLNSLKVALADSGNSNRADTVKDLARAAQSSLQSFFALIPEQDVKAVEELFTNARKADTNGDGRLSDDELIFMTPNEQEIWKRRVDKFG